MEHLTKMAEKHPVEIIAYWNNGERPIGKIRQDLLAEAKGEYVCFIDDDDWVPDYYLDEIFWALDEDYVGFKVQVWERDQITGEATHSIKHGVWHQEGDKFFRGVTHLN